MSNIQLTVVVSQHHWKAPMFSPLSDLLDELINRLMADPEFRPGPDQDGD